MTMMRGRTTDAEGTGVPATAWAPPWWTPLVVFLLSLLLRIFHVAEVTLWLDDTALLVPSAFTYMRYGSLGPPGWWTQPLKHVLLYASSIFFGNDPVGWRMCNVMFGTGSVLMTYLVARAMFRRPFPAIAAAALIALDPLSVAFSRNISEDTPATFFILLVCFFFIKAMKTDRERDWILTGLSLGAAWALRWYAVIPGLLMLVFALARHRKEGLPGMSRIVAYLGPLPLSIYVAAFLPWAARGYSVAEWFSLNVDAFHVQASGMEGMFTGLTRIAGPSRWFTTWIGAVDTAYRPGSYAAMFNDLPIWFLFVPAVAYLLWRGYKGRSIPALLVGGSFILLYVFFLTTRRSIMLYSSIPLLPFGAIALGFAADKVLGRRAWIFLAVAVAWSMYLFPIVSGMPVPGWAYGWLLARLGWS